jgi:hypothetical protein
VPGRGGKGMEAPGGTRLYVPDLKRYLKLRRHQGQQDPLRPLDRRSKGLDWASDSVQLHDSDTFKLLLDAGCDTGLFPWLRVAGVDSPELKHPRGQSRSGVHRRNAGKRRRHRG